MEKKKFTQPKMKVVNMATEQVIASSAVQSANYGVIESGTQGNGIFGATDYK